MIAVAAPSVRIFSRFRRSIVGLVALSLLAGCSPSQKAAERSREPSQVVARNDGARRREDTRMLRSNDDGPGARRAAGRKKGVR